MDPITIFKILRKRFALVLLPMLNAAAIAGILAVVSPPEFESTTLLRIVPYAAATPDYGTVVFLERLANTFSDILTSDLVTNEAKRRLASETLPDFEIQAIPETELMRLSVRDGSPAYAQTVANTLASLLIEQNRASFAADSEGIEPILRERLRNIEVQLNDLIAEQASLQNQVPRDTERIADTERAIAILQQNYNMALSSYNQASLSQLNRANAIRVVEPARFPASPIGPSPLRSVAFGSIIGLIGGVVLALIAESRNPHYFTVRQIEQSLAAPVVAFIPRINRLSRMNVFAGDYAAAEAFRRLRMTLFAEHKKPPLRTLLVTSAIPDEGKSTVALNLAASIAYNGQRVVLVEAEMRTPRLAKQFEAARFSGLSDVLRGEARPTEATVYSGISNLMLLPAGTVTFNATELLTANRLCPLLDDLMRRFDIVILDGPAVLAASDAMALAQHVQHVLWVINVEEANQRAIETAYQRMKAIGATVVGVVARGIEHPDDHRWIKTTGWRKASAPEPTVESELQVQ